MNSHIYVKNFDGKMIEIILPKGLNTTILEVKVLILKKITIDSEEFDLIYGGETLIDSNTLSEFGIQNKSTLHIVRRITGGGGFSFEFPDIKKAKEEEFAQTGPGFRIVNPGLNFLAYCDSCKEIFVIQIEFNKTENEFFDIGSMRNFLKCSNNESKSKYRTF